MDSEEPDLRDKDLGNSGSHGSERSWLHDLIDEASETPPGLSSVHYVTPALGGG